MQILFLDLDGTVREPKSGDKFINNPRDQQLIEGVKEAIAHYSSREWLIIGITNQGGVAAGHKQLEDAILEQRITLELVPELHSIFFCPDFEGQQCWEVRRDFAPSETRSFTTGDSAAGPWFKFIADPGQERLNFRKPGSGMITYAYSTIQTERCGAYKPAPLNDCWMIGDRPEDEQCASAANINFMWADVWRDRFKKGLGGVDLSDRNINKEILLRFLAT